MTADTKEAIAASTKVLLLEKGVKRLTVKEIVEECQITRQTFYYHFEDIPALIRWILEQDSKRTMQEVQSLENGLEKLRYLFLIAIQSMPYMKKGLQSNYRDDRESMLTQHLQNLFEHICDTEGLYQDIPRFETQLILRYHSQAILGLFRSWTQTDTQNLDQIVQTVFRLITEGIPPKKHG